MLTRAATVSSDTDKDSSCILCEEWLVLLVENVQLYYLRTVYVNKHQAIFILFSIFVFDFTPIFCM